MTTNKRIRVLLVDDHALFRAGTRLLLESQPDIEVVGEASNGEEAVTQAARLCPDAVLMDLAMPGVDGLEATRRIRAACADVHVLALTMHRNDEYFFQVLNAGASGYVVKEAAPEDLFGAVRAAARGDVFIHPSLARRLLDDYVRRVAAGEEKSSFDGLSPREQEILKLLASDYTNQQIADLLSLSAHTVQTHRGNIMTKLNLHSRAELLRYAIRKGLVRVEE